jgi:hypothetical protein
VYWRATPHDALPCFKKPVSSITRTASSSLSVSSAYYNIAQRVGIPLPPAKDRLLAPRAWIAGRLRPHPTRLARLTAQ